MPQIRRNTPGHGGLGPPITPGQLVNPDPGGHVLLTQSHLKDLSSLASYFTYLTTPSLLTHIRPQAHGHP